MTTILRHEIQQFDWTSPDSRECISYPVTQMLQDLEKGKLSYKKVIVPIDRVWAKEWLHHRIDDKTKPLVLSKNRYVMQEPVLFAMQSDGSGLLIDGSHRYMAAIILGWKEIRAHLIAHADWLPYAIAGTASCASHN